MSDTDFIIVNQFTPTGEKVQIAGTRNFIQNQYANLNHTIINIETSNSDEEYDVIETQSSETNVSSKKIVNSSTLPQSSSPEKLIDDTILLQPPSPEYAEKQCKQSFRNNYIVDIINDEESFDPMNQSDNDENTVYTIGELAVQCSKWFEIFFNDIFFYFFSE